MPRRGTDSAGPEESSPKAGDETVFAPGRPPSTERLLPISFSRQTQPSPGRRSLTEALGRNGHPVRAVRPRSRPVRDVALGATLRAAGIRLAARGAGRGAGPRIQPQDLRVRLRRARVGNLVLFVVDASGSMAARKRMVAVKGAMLGLLLEAYQKRDRVGLIAFRGQGAELLAPPTNSVELAERRLRRLPTGGRTPLAAGLALAEQVLARHSGGREAPEPLLVLVTDGRANVGEDPAIPARRLAALGIPGLVLDSEQGFVKMGKARELAQALGALYVPLDELSAGSIRAQVRRVLGARRGGSRETRIPG